MSRKLVDNCDMSSINEKSIKLLTKKQILLYCNYLREEIINGVSTNGGHLSSNLGVVESTVAIHRIFDLNKDKLIFDVGHQCYAHKLITGRKLDKLRQKDGISGFPCVEESKFDVYESGHSSNSLSAAVGMALTRDLNKEKYDIVVLIGDASISNGVSFEALNDLDMVNHKIIVILNDNGMSISRTVGRISGIIGKVQTSKFYNSFKIRYKAILKLGRFGRSIYGLSYKIKSWLKAIVVRNNIFTDMGFDYYGAVDGNNEAKVENALERAKISNKSIIIHIKTKKGHGYKCAEEDLNGYYHGVPAFDKTKGPVHSSQSFSINEIVSTKLHKVLIDNSKSVLLCPGTMVGSKIDCLQAEFGETRVKDVGISEEHCFSLAAGMCINNYHPIISIYSTFMQRSFDQISNDLARMNYNVTLIIDRSGLGGSDGNTHHGILDENFLLSLPNTTVCMPSSIELINDLIDESLNNHGVFAIRVPKRNIYSDKETYEYKGYGKRNKLVDKNNSQCLVTFGPVIKHILEFLEMNNKSIDIIDAIYQKPMDTDMILNDLMKYSKIIIYNIYSVKNGFNNVLIAYLVEHGYKGQIVSLGLDNKFIKQQTTTEGLKENKISLEDLINCI